MSIAKTYWRYELPAFGNKISLEIIVFYKSVWKAHRYGWARSKYLSINRFDVGHIRPVRKVGEAVSNDAIDLSLSFILNIGVDGHKIEEAAGHGSRL